MKVYLFEEAQSLVKQAYQRWTRGDKDGAIALMDSAISRIETLIMISHPSVKRIWEEILVYLKNARNELLYKSPPRFASGQVTAGPIGSSLVKKVSTRELKELPDICKSGAFSVSKPKLTYDNYVGYEEVKNELRENIDWQLNHPEIFDKLKLSPLKGILLFGPPGTGKTFLAEVTAGHFSLPFISVSPSTIMDKYVGESEKIIRAIFECAEAIAPSVILIDEIDKVLPKETHGTDVTKRIEAEILQILDGVNRKSGFIVFFASNEPWNINPALIRPGRVDRVIYIGPPDEKARAALFKVYLDGVPLSSEINFKELARLTAPVNGLYYSASGIKQICDEAKRELARQWIRYGKETLLTKEIILNAIKKVRRNISEKDIQRYIKWGKETGLM